MGGGGHTFLRTYLSAKKGQGLQIGKGFFIYRQIFCDDDDDDDDYDNEQKNKKLEWNENTVTGAMEQGNEGLREQHNAENLRECQ
jgi:hypothetical protein